MAGVAAELKRAGLAFELKVVAVKKIDPNPWNPNRMDEATLKAEHESISTFGFIDPVTVRPHPSRKDRWQIIDGEHRWKLAPDLDYDEIPCVVLDVDTPTAKRLTVILNETRGEADAVALGTLLADLRNDLGDDLSTGLRYSEEELGHLVDLADEEWEAGFDGGDAEDPGNPQGEEEFVTFTARIPAEVSELVAKGMEKIDEPDPAKAIANGQLLQLALRSLLKS